MTSISTTWTQRNTVAFTAGTLADISSCVTFIQGHLHRGTLGANTTPTSTQVQQFIIFAKQKLAAKYGFTWRRKFVYAATTSGTYQYALPADFAGGGTILRDITGSGEKLVLRDPATFDSLYPDVAGATAKAPEEYCIKDRELWLSAPADGTYTLELEYPRTGDDSTATDISWLPELARFQVCNYAIYRAFIMLQQWDAAQAFKGEWAEDIYDSKKSNARNKWASMGYQAKNWQYVKL